MSGRPRGPDDAPEASSELRSLDGGEVLLFDEAVTIGRHPLNDLVLEQSKISNRHAAIEWDGARWWIRDLGSRNGTLVNRRPIDAATAIRVGDVIGVGASTVSVRLISSANGKDEDSVDSFGEHTVFRPANELLEMSSADTPPVGVGEEVLQRYTQRLRTLNEVHQALGRSVTIEELLEPVAAAVDTPVDHGVIALAISDLSEAGLVVIAADAIPAVSRRSLIAKLGAGAAAAAALPVV